MGRPSAASARICAPRARSRASPVTLQPPRKPAGSHRARAPHKGAIAVRAGRHARCIAPRRAAAPASP
eukprot:4789227-Prymnesium_polylepis.1